MEIRETREKNKIDRQESEVKKKNDDEFAFAIPDWGTTTSIERKLEGSLVDHD